MSNADARVQFVGDRASDLEDPVFIARAGETNRVALLIGKTYEAHCDMPLFCVSRECNGELLRLHGQVAECLFLRATNRTYAR